MYCQKCGNELSENAKFCGKCGASTKGDTKTVVSDIKKEESIIKCGNCGYIGEGEPARSTAGKILAWICVVFAPLVTIIYFVATHKYKCPKCKSTFLGIKNKDGVFLGQNGSSRPVVILIYVIVGIAILGILSSVVLASLNTARQKGADAAVKAALNNSRAEAELFYDRNDRNHYLGLCTQDTNLINDLSTAAKSGSNSETTYVCNDSSETWAASAPLKSEGYWCVDSIGNSKKTLEPLTYQTSCIYLKTQ